MTEQEKDILKYHRIQITLANLFYKLAKRRLKNVPKEVQWLVLSRAVNAIFHHHYGMSYDAVKKHEQLHPKEPEHGET